MNARREWAQERYDRAGHGASFRPLYNKRDVGGGLADLVKCDPQLWVASCQAAWLAGLGVLVSPTSDGGALSLTVYDGDQRHRSYCASAEEFNRALEALRDLAVSKGL